jgi:predicted RNA-binding protein (virulence factor B family)
MNKGVEEGFAVYILPCPSVSLQNQGFGLHSFRSLSSQVDVSLRAFGATQYEVDKAYLEEQLIINGGIIALTSKSSPEEIAAKLQLTKNGFKKAVGGLMKIGRALEKPEGIVLIEEGESGEIDRT